VKTEQPATPKSNPGKKNLTKYLRFSTFGLEIGVAAALGILIGWYLDRLLGTHPWLLVIFTLFGLAAGFRSIFRLLREMERENKDGEDRL
jgi:ATP synthase protein I